MRGGKCTHLRAEALPTSIDNATKGFVASMAENVSLQPRTGAGSPTKYFTTCPQTHIIFTHHLGVYMVYLKH